MRRYWINKPNGAKYSTGVGPPLCCCLSMCTPSPVTGAAMVDLLAQYEKVGLQLNCRELPDHLPLYLEYLSVLPEAEAKKDCRTSHRFWRCLAGA